ncbi:MAG: carbohydrate ABC transporter permease [Spirochaetaceae bacterium]|jgi:putative aldouronate transport system permease protein|nr:carbohydrate ABC transporter permease [Spirochaetaceae bacterium]
MKTRNPGLTVLNYFLVGLFAIVCIIPMLLVLSISLTSTDAIRRYGYQLWPREWSGEAYRLIFMGNSSVYQGYIVSVSVTVVGTILAVAITAMCAFALVNKNVQYRNKLAFYFFVPMVLSGGLVPWYLMCRNLKLIDNFWALVIPSLLFNPFNMFLCRNFMRDIPDSLMESAKLDGAQDFRICFQIYFPLSTPVIATVALFYGIAYWNDWFNAIMLVNKEDLFPLQYMLMKIQSEIEALKHVQPGVPVKNLPSDSLKMATAIVTIGPIILLYPYLQKYFVKGLIIGGVKG